MVNFGAGCPRNAGSTQTETLGLAIVGSAAWRNGVVTPEISSGDEESPSVHRNADIAINRAGTRICGMYRARAGGHKSRRLQVPSSRGRALWPGRAEAQGIDGTGRQIELVVQVRSRGSAGISGARDDLSLRDVIALTDEQLLVVEVDGGDAAAVI